METPKKAKLNIENTDLPETIQMSELHNDVRAKVLIAEDDAIVALDLQGMVMRLGYDVVAIADSGPAAIAAALRFMPDIILLDMVLKGTYDGIEVAREIHKSQDIPIVFCVSSPDLSILVRAKEISYAGYLLKPINPDSLSTTLDTALYKYRLEKRVEQAEARFRGLADKCEVLQFFFNQKAAFEWVWSPENGSHVSGYTDHEAIPRADIEEKINTMLSFRFSSNPLLVGKTDGESGNRITGLLEFTSERIKNAVFTLIGVRSAETGQVNGILIPLAGGLQ